MSSDWNEAEGAWAKDAGLLQECQAYPMEARKMGALALRAVVLRPANPLMSTSPTPKGRRMWRLVFGGFFFLLAGCLGASPPPPWGGEGHKGGLLVESASRPLLAALEWGRSNAEKAERLIDAYYRQAYLEGSVTQRAALHTKWTHLARYAASQAQAGRPIDPKAVESITASPSLTIELTLQGYHRGLLQTVDVFLVQRGSRIYPDRARADTPRLTTDREKEKVYEGTLWVDFPYEKLNLRHQARVLIRRDEGSDLFFDFGLGGYK